MSMTDHARCLGFKCVQRRSAPDPFCGACWERLTDELRLSVYTASTPDSYRTAVELAVRYMAHEVPVGVPGTEQANE